MKPKIKTTKRSPSFGPDERFVSVRLAAQWLGVSEVTVKNWVDAGKLRAARTAGGHRRIASSSVAAQLESQGRSVPAELQPPKLKAIIVSTDVPFAKSLSRSLTRKIEVEVVDTDLAAALSAGRMRPGLIVLDLEAKGVDSKRLYEALRADEATRESDVIGFAAKPPARGVFAKPDTNGETEGLVYFFRRRDRDEMVSAALAVAQRNRGQRVSR